MTEFRNKYIQYKGGVVEDNHIITYLYYPNDNSNPQSGGVFLFAANEHELSHDSIDYHAKQFHNEDNNIPDCDPYGGGILKRNINSLGFVRDSIDFPGLVPENILDEFIHWYTNVFTVT